MDHCQEMSIRSHLMSDLIQELHLIFLRCGLSLCKQFFEIRILDGFIDIYSHGRPL